MILPFFLRTMFPNYPNSLKLFSFKSAPVTWLLVVINTIICFYTTGVQNKTRQDIDEFYDHESLVRAQGEVFAEYISQHPEEYNNLLLKMSDLARQGNHEQRDALGRLALRDRSFAIHAQELETQGDKVQLEYWKTEYEKIRTVLDKDPVTRWGLGMNDTGLIKWFSYQFLHGGFVHLFSNLVFLMIFGSLLEPVLGSVIFLFSYLISGFFAAGAFIELSGLSGVPLVGASGAISGLMGIIVAMYWREKLDYIYWILPVKGYVGIVSLPAWVLLILWGASDLAGYLGTIRELGGIAHAAHIGGALHGLVLGCFFRIWSKTSPHGVFSNTAGF